MTAPFPFSPARLPALVPITTRAEHRAYIDSIVLSPVPPAIVFDMCYSCNEAFPVRDLSIGFGKWLCRDCEADIGEALEDMILEQAERIRERREERDEYGPVRRRSYYHANERE